MKRSLLAAAAMLLMATTAQAASKPLTFFNGTYWQTWGMVSNNDGYPMCAVQTGRDIYRLYIKWTLQNGMTIQVWKANWRLAPDRQPPGWPNGSKVFRARRCS